MYKRWSLLAAAVLLATSLYATPITNIYSTGVCGGGNTGCGSPGALLAANTTDNNWSFISGPLTGTSFVANAPIPPWVANGPNSQWLSVAPPGDTTKPPGIYVIQQTFSLAGFLANTLSLSFSVTSDNSFIVRLNGTQIFSSTQAGCIPEATGGGTPCYQQLWASTVSNVGIAGLNTLEIEVTNVPSTGNTPLGVRFEVTSADAQPDIPEPATWVLMGLGLAAVAVMRRRRAA